MVSNAQAVHDALESIQRYRDEIKQLKERKMFMAQFTSSGDREYTGFGETPEKAKQLCLRGYRLFCRANSGIGAIEGTAQEVLDACMVVEIKEGSCWVDLQNEIIENWRKA